LTSFFSKKYPLSAVITAFQKQGILHTNFNKVAASNSLQTLSTTCTSIVRLMGFSLSKFFDNIALFWNQTTQTFSRPTNAHDSTIVLSKLYEHAPMKVSFCCFELLGEAFLHKLYPCIQLSRDISKCDQQKRQIPNFALISTARALELSLRLPSN
jgi:hypothetical protein